ncbi:MAG: hypothetical protein U5K29_03930 [Acidimicrobiales bacterium]|nr:hypothetical protein [Acidimicrobiales bacterium]
MEPVVARKMWRTLEPYHGIIYFTPETTSAYAGFGLEGQGSYFASRAAAMGPVPAEVVVATFFNFDPRVVHAAIPLAWERGDPPRWIEARVQAVDRALRGVLGASVDSPEMAEAAELARHASEGCHSHGRPLYGGHAALDWPDAPHLVLWHAITLLREFRGDGHVACLVAEGLDGCQALVMHAASGDVGASALAATRGWSADAWSSAVAVLAERGLVTPDGELTDAGRQHRQALEDRTDELAMAPWRHLGEQGCDRLRSLVRPFSKAIVDSGTFGIGGA